MKNKFVKLPQDKELALRIIDDQTKQEAFRAERGWIGNFWGGKDSVPHNIAALAIVFCFVIGTIYTLLCYDIKVDEIGLSIKDLWMILVPIITLCVGYLFGKKTPGG